MRSFCIARPGSSCMNFRVVGLQAEEGFYSQPNLVYVPVIECSSCSNLPR